MYSTCGSDTARLLLVPQHGILYIDCFDGATPKMHLFSATGAVLLARKMGTASRTSLILLGRDLGNTDSVLEGAQHYELHSGADVAHFHAAYADRQVPVYSGVATISWSTFKGHLLRKGVECLPHRCQSEPALFGAYVDADLMQSLEQVTPRRIHTR